MVFFGVFIFVCLACVGDLVWFIRGGYWGAPSGLPSSLIFSLPLSSGGSDWMAAGGACWWGSDFFA